VAACTPVLIGTHPIRWELVLAAGLSSGGLLTGLTFGGVAYIKHFLLRFFLWRLGCIPWKYVRFLEEVIGHILLQRVGGGYRFIHPLFLDYFASLGTPAPPPSVQSPPHNNHSSYFIQAKRVFQAKMAQKVSNRCFTPSL